MTATCWTAYPPSFWASMVKVVQKALQTTRNGKSGKHNPSGLSKQMLCRHDRFQVWQTRQHLSERSSPTQKHANTRALSNALRTPSRSCKVNELRWKILRLPATDPG